jgi:hypothetical protein
MPRGVMVVFTTPIGPEAEREFNEWYDGTHVPDVLEIDGVTGATRYRLTPTSGEPQDVPPLGHSYVALYTLDAPDFQAVIDEIRARAGDGRMELTPALDRRDRPPVVLLYEQVEHVASASARD